MNSTTAQFVSTRRTGIYEPLHQIEMWGDFKEYPDSIASAILQVESKLDSQLLDPSNGLLAIPNGYEQETTQANKPPEKVQRRLAQNREAARKSRLRKKAYVQQLENCKLRLLQLEQEVERARQRGQYAGGGLDVSQLNYSSTINSGNNAFELEYAQWVEGQNRQIEDLRNALLSKVSDAELFLLVESIRNHYVELFRMKAMATKADVFYVMTGMWKTSVERLFLWLGGFRPSEILKILSPRMEFLTEEQRLHVGGLTQSCQQAEDALSQGMEKLHDITAETVAGGLLGEANYLPQIKAAAEKLEALARFVNQADYLRQETIQQMCKIMNTRQAARALLVLGEYLQRLRNLSSSWTERHRKAAKQG